VILKTLVVKLLHHVILKTLVVKLHPLRAKTVLMELMMMVTV
jgi:hypothetical protein